MDLILQFTNPAEVFRKLTTILIAHLYLLIHRTNIAWNSLRSRMENVCVTDIERSVTFSNTL
jgi:hypothetical protein